MSNTPPSPVASPVAPALPTAISPLRFRDALTQAQPAMASLRDDELLDVNLDIPSAVVAVLGYGESDALKELRPRIAEELPKFNLDHFDKLVIWALAAGQAHTEFLATSKSLDYQGTVSALEEKRDTMRSDLQALAKRKLIDGTRLAEARGTSGHKNLAFDVLLYCAIFRAHWTSIAGRTAITVDEIDRAEQQADHLATTLGARELGNAAPSAAAEARTRAFTLMVKAHDALRSAVAYLRWAQGDADRILPSLYANRGNTRRKSTQPEEPVVDGPIVAPPPTDPAPTPGGNAPPTPPNPGSTGGMPDEDPFTRGG